MSLGSLFFRNKTQYDDWVKANSADRRVPLSTRGYSEVSDAQGKGASVRIGPRGAPQPQQGMAPIGKYSPAPSDDARHLQAVKATAVPNRVKGMARFTRPRSKESGYSLASQYFQKLSQYADWVKESRGYPSAVGRMVTPPLSERAANAGAGMTLPEPTGQYDPSTLWARGATPNASSSQGPTQVAANPAPSPAAANAQGQGAPVRRAQSQPRRAPQAQQGEVPSGQTGPTPPFAADMLRVAYRNAASTQGSSTARAQLAANARRVASGEAKPQSFEEWSKGREGWSEDARIRRYVRSPGGLAYAAIPRPRQPNS